jgi:hypothetical protein
MKKTIILSHSDYIISTLKVKIFSFFTNKGILDDLLKLFPASKENFTYVIIDSHIDNSFVVTLYILILPNQNNYQHRKVFIPQLYFKNSRLVPGVYTIEFDLSIETYKVSSEGNVTFIDSNINKLISQNYIKINGENKNIVYKKERIPSKFIYRVKTTNFSIFYILNRIQRRVLYTCIFTLFLSLVLLFIGPEKSTLIQSNPTDSEDTYTTILSHQGEKTKSFNSILKILPIVFHTGDIDSLSYEENVLTISFYSIDPLNIVRSLLKNPHVNTIKTEYSIFDQTSKKYKCLIHIELEIR